MALYAYVLLHFMSHLASFDVVFYSGFGVGQAFAIFTASVTFLYISFLASLELFRRVLEVVVGSSYVILRYDSNWTHHVSSHQGHRHVRRSILFDSLFVILCRR